MSFYIDESIQPHYSLGANGPTTNSTSLSNRMFHIFRLISQHEHISFTCVVNVRCDAVSMWWSLAFSKWRTNRENRNRFEAIAAQSQSRYYLVPLMCVWRVHSTENDKSKSKRLNQTRILLHCKLTRNPTLHTILFTFIIIISERLAIDAQNPEQRLLAVASTRDAGRKPRIEHFMLYFAIKCR